MIIFIGVVTTIWRADDFCVAINIKKLGVLCFDALTVNVPDECVAIDRKICY